MKTYKIMYVVDDRIYCHLEIERSAYEALKKFQQTNKNQVADISFLEGAE